MIMACLPVSTVLLGGDVFIHKLLKQQIFKWWTAKEDSTKHSHLYYMLLLVVEKKKSVIECRYEAKHWLCGSCANVSAVSWLYFL